MTLVPKIAFGEARNIAKKQAAFNLSSFVEKDMDILDADYLEAENCWMFFRNRKICIPDSALLGIEWAYVVSKRGKFSMVQDFSSDRGKMFDYLNTMSDYFARTGG